MHANDVTAKDLHVADYCHHLKSYLETIVAEAHRIQQLIEANELILSQNFIPGSQIRAGDGQINPELTVAPAPKEEKTTDHAQAVPANAPVAAELGDPVSEQAAAEIERGIKQLLAA